jgi:hypothetical protein
VIGGTVITDHKIACFCWLGHTKVTLKSTGRSKIGLQLDSVFCLPFRSNPAAGVSSMRKPLFLPFWVIGLFILIIYIAGLLTTLVIFDVPAEWAKQPINQNFPALQNAAALGEASALVGSFLTVISTFFLLYTIYLQLRIRDEQAVEAHWFELLKRWSEFAEDKELIDHATDYEHQLAKVELSFPIPDSADHLSEREGLEEITQILGHEGFLKLPRISETLDRLFSAMMTLRERISGSGRNLLDNSLLPFVSQHVLEALVYSALFRADQNTLRSLTQLGLVERALPYAPETRWFLTRHYGSSHQIKQKARARQQEKQAHQKDVNDKPHT